MQMSVSVANTPPSRIAHREHLIRLLVSRSPVKHFSLDPFEAPSHGPPFPGDSQVVHGNPNDTHVVSGEGFQSILLAGAHSSIGSSGRAAATKRSRSVILLFLSIVKSAVKLQAAEILRWQLQSLRALRWMLTVTLPSC